MRHNKDITIYDIARELNISAATVSRGLKNNPVISEETRIRIQELAALKGYRPNTVARNLRRQKTNAIGMIVPRLDSYFIATVLAGIETVISPAGFHLIITQSFESVQKEITNTIAMFNSRVDALIVSLAADTTDISHFEPFWSKGIPVFFFDRVCDKDYCQKFVIDNYEAAYALTSHMISQGCRKIIHIAGNTTKNVYYDRMNGYKNALTDHGIKVKPSYILVNNLSLQAGIVAAEKILALKPLPDGVFVANDLCAACCMQMFKEKGLRIPEDIAVAGFNNDPVSRLVEPRLTTVNYPGELMGKLVATCLIDKLNGKSPADFSPLQIIKSELLIRGSTSRI
ncbi:MAG: LacI family DNA-binding transcriptional regulator [Bacteroidales bacterium]|nr:LacI family DNA-binding transcriptional regulator [Bacteroidales bacterium]